MSNDQEKQQAHANYRALQAKVDAKFDEIRGRNQAAITCRRGCHSCCKPGLTVSAIEAASLREYLAGHPEVAARALAVERDDPHAGARCAFLTKDGGCGIYEARPLVCRSHGVPIALKTTPGEGGKARRDVCPLNFAGMALEAIDANDVINVDMLNTILALINAQYTGGKAGQKGEGEGRTALRPSALTPSFPGA